jgi:rhodanese-related sulfurtransferase
MIHRIRTGCAMFALLALVALGSVTAVRAQDFPQIKPEALKEIIEKGDRSVVIVDAQPKEAYDLGHIKGAVNLPWAADLRSKGDLPKDKMLVIYCDCGHEEDSIDVANQLKEKWGYTNIMLLEGGWSNWQKLGYPIEKGGAK